MENLVMLLGRVIDFCGIWVDIIRDKVYKCAIKL